MSCLNMQSISQGFVERNRNLEKKNRKKGRLREGREGKTRGGDVKRSVEGGR